jgi:hypothetical protein
VDGGDQRSSTTLHRWGRNDALQRARAATCSTYSSHDEQAIAENHDPFVAVRARRIMNHGSRRRSAAVDLGGLSRLHRRDRGRIERSRKFERRAARIAARFGRIDSCVCRFRCCVRRIVIARTHIVARAHRPLRTGTVERALNRPFSGRRVLERSATAPAGTSVGMRGQRPARILRHAVRRSRGGAAARRSQRDGFRAAPCRLWLRRSVPAGRERTADLPSAHG